MPSCPNCGRANACPLSFTQIPSATTPSIARGLNGIFNVNKPAGRTSHDVVNRIRRTSGAARVGHAGTLDPMATGVLLICVGQGVRVSEYLIDHDKKYRARIRLGATTDTDDAMGKIIAENAVNVTREQIENALAKFTGKISQMPPAYSAIKRAGVPMYKLARKGVEVESEPRNVEIYKIELREMALPEFEIDVHCSKGTYIRSIARDVGDVLGCGGHLSALTRTASGRFDLKDSIDLDALIAAFETKFAEHYLHPLDEALLSYEAIIVEPQLARDIQMGKLLDCGREYTTPLLRAYSTDGECIALLEHGYAPGIWKPKKVFA